MMWQKLKSKQTFCVSFILFVFRTMTNIPTCKKKEQRLKVRHSNLLQKYKDARVKKNIMYGVNIRTVSL